MATSSKSTAATEPPTEPDPQAVAAEQAKVQEQADKDRDEVAKAAAEAPGETQIPANFEDAAAYARVADEQQAEQAEADAPAQQAADKEPAEGKK